MNLPEGFEIEQSLPEGFELENAEPKTVSSNVKNDQQGFVMPDKLSVYKQLMGLEKRTPNVLTEDVQVDENTPWLEVLSKSVESAPNSGFEYVKDVFNTVLHPIDTMKGVAGLAAGAVQKFTEGVQPQEQNVDMLVDYLKNKYGSLAGFKRTVANKPIEVLADVSTFLIPGGAALKSLSVGSKTRILGKIGQVLSESGAVLDPLNLAKRGIIGSVKPLIPKTLPSNLYKRAVKFSSAIPEDKVSDFTKTALKNEILPTAGGLYKLRSKINVFNKEITDMIAVSEASGSRLKISSFLKHIKKLRKNALYASDERAINRVVDDFVKQQAVNKGRLTVTPKEAQVLKQKLYSELETAYNKLTAKPISTEAKMAIARGIKDSLEEVIPEIKQLNASEKSLIDLRKAINSRVSTISKGSLIPFNASARSMAGGALGGPIGAASGFTAGLLSGPTIQAKLAIVLDKLKNKGVKIRPTRQAIALGLILPERIKQGESNE